MRPVLSLPFALACFTASALLGSQPCAPGLDELVRLDLLPAFKSSVYVGSVSSYDRSGGNDDGFSGKYSFVRKDAEGLVLADLKGPGVIYRIWTPTPSDDMLEFLFDGETKPALELKFRELFLGNDPDFPRPLAGFGAGGFYSYVPIPFARSCVVRMRAPNVQFYQINYAQFAPGTAITSFSRSHPPGYTEALQKACRLWDSSGKDLSSFAAPAGAKVQVTSTAKQIPPSGRAVLFQSNKGGRIVGLRLSPANVMAGKARDLLLRISFDGQKPAVDCPLGDFFGYAWGQPATKSLLLGTDQGTNYCWFPMPFEKNATIEIVSQRPGAVQINAEVWHCAVPREKSEGQFYAAWRRENPTTLGKPYTFLETTGRGHLVGVTLQAQGMESGKTLFFEGDDQTYLDGELRIHGTGSEDFFNGGWYDVPDRWEKQISFPMSGCLGYAKHLGRTGAYRFFVGDAYPYKQSLKQTIEHSGQNNDIVTDYSSVSFFYSEQRPTCELAAPPLSARAVVDPREVIFPANWQLPIYAWSFDRATLSRKREKIGSEEVRYLSLSATGDDWFGSHFICFWCDVPESGFYTVSIDAVKSPGQAKVQLFQNENPAGPIVDLYAAQPTRSGRVPAGKLRFVEGKNTVMLKLVGKNDASSGLGLDLVEVFLLRD